MSALFAPRSIRPADPAKASALQQRAISVLKDLGFEEAELARSWNGEGEIPLRDHRMQLLIRDAILWRDAQQKAAAAVKRPVPPVQRQGVAQTKNAGREVQSAQLSKQLENASGQNASRMAAALVAAHRAAQ